MTPASTLAARFRARLRALGIAPDDALVVAVSGGADSVALLHLLRFAVDGPPERLVVAHFDHRMRVESAADAAWVRGLARAWGLRAVQGAAEQVPGGEAEARTARWRFLEATRVDAGARAVVTGHHRDDQVETVLHHLARGSGLRGRSGIRPWQGTRLRPLLDEPRAELRAWARAVGLGWRADPTNALPLGPRNRIRNELLPLLEDIRPGAARAIARSAELAAADETALAEAERLLLEPLVRSREAGRVEVDLPRLRAFPEALSSRLLRRLSREVGGRLDRAGTRAALAFTLGGPGGAESRLPSGVVLRRSQESLEVEGPRLPERPADRSLRVTDPFVRGSAAVVVGGERWSVHWGAEVPDGGEVVQLAHDPGAPGFRVRGWREGDHLDGRPLSRLWSEAGVPLYRRLRRPVVEDAAGRLLWVPGSALSHTARDRGGPLYRIGITHVDES
ncbi:tRNA lysidine(34) synthetase TilS [Gaopeijia maritima]|uniref:tRNA(Ile)-lysidine synthase n=1 Tax=Gaopeijia maritima TaxID=3119007 RepID=A0ABU9EDF6_9BACT